MSRHPDVVVIGGGVIGSAIAWRLAQAGAAVTLIERAEPGRAATWAAAGMLSPLGEITHPAFRMLGRASLDIYAGFVSELREFTSTEIEFAAPGKIEVAFDVEDIAHLRTKHPPVLEPAAALELEPALSDKIVGAVFYPGDAFVDNRALGAALWRAAGRAGATVRAGVSVQAVQSKDGKLESILLGTGEEIGCERVVVCSGAWSGGIAGLPRALPVGPVKGQMVALRSSVRLEHMLQSEHSYIIPRIGGRVLVGATVEHAGFDARTTAGGIEAMLSAARLLVPELAKAELVETWTGFRPGTPDDLPILGIEPLLPGLVYATGHYRNGILLAPITAQLIAALLTGADPGLPLDAFSVQRFAE